MPGVLFLVHAQPPDENSGAPLAADGYARSLAERGRSVAIVHAGPGACPWTVGPLHPPYRPGADGVVRLAVPNSPWLGENWAVEAPSDETFDATGTTDFAYLLREFAPDVVHVVDNIHLPLRWPEAARAGGIPVVRSVSCAEDLCGLIAPVSNASDPEGYCRPPITPERCATCVSAGGNIRYTWPGHQLAGDNGLSRALLTNRRERLVEKLEKKRDRAEFQFSAVFDRVVFSSRGFAEYFSATLRLDPSKVRVIEMGLDSSGFPPRDRPPAGDDGPLIFCLAGTVDPNKGHGDVARAFLSAELLGRSDYRLVLMGGGDLSPLSELLDRNPNVTFSGPFTPKELPQLLSATHVGLTTSRFETFHRVTREYLLAGLPVVANAVFGVTDIVGHGRNGLLYHDADAGQLARAVVRLLDDRHLYRRLAEGARATEVRTLSDEMDELESLYDELVAGRR